MPAPKILAAAALVASSLSAGLIGSAGSAAAGPLDFEERWCSTDPAPCVESATLNGATVTEASADWEIQLTGALTNDGNRYFQWLVQDLGGPADLATTDQWELVFDTGTIDPLYTEGYSGVPEAERVVDGDGTFHLTYAARPVLTAFACDPQGAWPTTCPTVAPDSTVSVMLYGEVQDKAGDEDFRGFDVAQNVDEVNGPFLETAPDGSQFLESFMANSHQYDADPGAGVTPADFKGQVRWRLPYRMLRNWFGIPNPELMVPSSLTGAVRHPDGSTGSATFTFTHDPVGNAWVVDVTDIGFSRNVLRVKTGKITPTRPTQVSATRTAARRGFVDFDPSKARGAKVTGYVGQCVSRTDGQGIAQQSDNILRFTGLRAGVGYDCKVRATSKVGPSRWSETVRMPAQPSTPG
jgi:hypothetical protein